MSVVVERGLARCPRCVAVADYTFVESGSNSLRYEVQCGKCGESYCEVHTPVAPDFTAAAAGALVVREPEFEPHMTPDHRQRVVAWLGEAGAHLTEASTRTASWVVAKVRGLRR